MAKIERTERIHECAELGDMYLIVPEIHVTEQDGFYKGQIVKITIETVETVEDVTLNPFFLDGK